MQASDHGRKIGYARVSTADQTAGLQCDALRAIPCAKIFVDEDASGADLNRPALHKALASLRPGDTLVVWKLDRLARSIQDLLDITSDLRARDIGFESLTEKLDTSSVFGEFTFHVIAAVAHMERRLIAERTVAGLQAAKKRGKRLGRKPKLSVEAITAAHECWRSGEPPQSIAARHGVAPITLMRAFARMESMGGVS
ncbi:MAG: recombinase family protein [Alphaproteobacteria bacterium]|nr:recombinase family protein [Alphaproteobacteria bacterium]